MSDLGALQLLDEDPGIVEDQQQALKKARQGTTEGDAAEVRRLEAQFTALERFRQYRSQ
jgi:hypothetical protein